jgi:uncharacterized tellurite resistance protein B-like protein
MDNTNKTQNLLKILMGAAWIDGTIQQQEREYLHKMAKDHGCDDDPEIKMLFSEAKPIKPQECYEWLEAYLGDHPTEESYQELLAELSVLIYSDGLVETEEAKLLNRLQLLDPTIESAQPKTVFDKLLRGIQKIYKQAIQ